MTVEEFTKQLKENHLHISHADLIDESWYELFSKLLPELKVVYDKLKIERDKEVTIYPTDTQIFKAFKECKLENLNTIILAQDPYYTSNMANGLAFDNVKKSLTKLSPSLLNIIKEMNSDNIIPNSSSSNSYLGHLPSQGVLLLNTALTVEKGKPESHLETWRPFTEKLLKELGKQSQLIWCLWGAKALIYIDVIEEGVHTFTNLRESREHKMIISSHPSPYSAHKSMQGYPAFLGSKPFSRVNEYLKKWNKTEIKW